MPDKPKSALQQIIAFFEYLEPNNPVAIKEIELATGLSWTYIKKLLRSGKLNVEFKKSANTWIAWKTSEHVGIKYSDSCASLLRSDIPPEKQEEMDKYED